jgi:hypothetical protein
MTDNNPQLPELHIELTGLVKASNFDAFKSQAIAVFKNINTDLQSDDDFADAEQTAKWCKGVEDKLKTAKEKALGQTASIDELFRTIDEISEQARQARLTLERSVKVQKETVKTAMVEGYATKLIEYTHSLNKRLKGNYLSANAQIFDEAIKGKKTIGGMKTACEESLVSEKLSMNDVANRIEININTMVGDGFDHRHLMPDIQTVATKEAEVFAAILNKRIDEERIRKEAEVERIRAEERAKAERDAQHQARLEQAQREADERQQREKAIRESAQEVNENIALQAPSKQPGDRQVKKNAQPESPFSEISPNRKEAAKTLVIRDDVSAFMSTRDFGDDTMLVRYVLVEFRKFVDAIDACLVRERQAELNG